MTRNCRTFQSSQTGGILYLNIYGQQYAHDPIYIAGTPDALRMLIVQIECALEHEQSSTEFMTTYGEVYMINVVNPDEEELSKWETTYPDVCLCGHQMPKERPHPAP